MNHMSSSALDLSQRRGKVWILEGIIVSSGPILASNCLISDLCLQYIRAEQSENYI